MLDHLLLRDYDDVPAGGDVGHVGGAGEHLVGGDGLAARNLAAHESLLSFTRAVLPSKLGANG